MPAPVAPASATHRATPAPQAAPLLGSSAPEDQPGSPLASGPTYTWPLPAGLDLAHLHVVLTGGTSGIGLEAAKVLCAKNARVFIVGADLHKGQQALRLIHAAVPKARVDFFECDLTSLRSVRKFAEAYRLLGAPLHVLALNAGQFLPPYRKSPEGFEQTLAANYLGHFLLAHLLLPELQAATPSRIVWQGSAFEQLGTLQWGDLGGEFARDSGLAQYCNSKLCCLMAAREMARRLKGSGVDVFACQPGLVDTPAFDRSASGKGLAWLFAAAARVAGQSPRRAAASLVYTAGATELDGKGGAYFGPPYLGPLFSNFFNTTPLVPLNPRAHSAANCLRLYDETARLLEGVTGQPLPNKLPALYREHGWQERAAGRDTARPVEPSLPASPPPYRAHEAVAHLKQAMHGGGGGPAAQRGQAEP